MSSGAIFVRLAQGEGVGSLVIAAFRLLTASAVVTLIALAQQAWKDYAKLKAVEVGALILSGVLLGLHFATWITSLAHTSVVSSLVLVSTTPLWTGLASPLILKERTPHTTWIGILAAIAGGTLISLADWSGSSSSSFAGNLLAISGAILMAGYLMIGRRVRNRMRFIAYLWIVYGTAAVLLAAVALVFRLPAVGFAAPAYIWMIALGLIPQLIGHSAANYAVRHMSATLVAVSILGEPVGSTLLAIVVLGEWPGLLHLAGGVLILGGILIASGAERRTAKTP
jgi:drug/metabolite transporter (DMT)-like permease